MRTYLFAIGLWLLCGPSQAQLKFGLRAGLSSSTIKVDEVIQAGTDEWKLETADATVGFHAGVFSRIQLFNVFLQPELLFTNSGGEVKVTDINGIEEIRAQKFNKIDIPILAGMKFGPLRVEAGPSLSFLLSSKSDLFESEAYKEDFKKATMGFQAGVGFDILKTLAFDIKYEGNLSKLGDGVTLAGDNIPFDSRNRQWIASVGVFF